jgi:predicted helicase
MIENYNDQVRDFQEQVRSAGVRDVAGLVDTFIDTDPARISWSRSLKQSLIRGRLASFADDRIYEGAYRPFCAQHVYFDASLNEMVYRIPALFPTADHGNVGICLTGASSHFEFSVIATDRLPNLHLLDTGQFFPRWTYAKADDVDPTLDGSTEEVDDHGCVRIDNVTDDALAMYRAAYGEGVTTDDVFHYVYGLLHSPDYRARYAADLKKALPRIPLVAADDDFWAFSRAGARLLDLHIGYEAVDPYPLAEHDSTPGGVSDVDRYRVEKMRHPGTGRNKDLTRLVYNADITLSGIPEEAHRYLVGSRSALAWMVDRYQVRIDKDSGIANDPNDWAIEHDDPRYIIDLVKRVVTVSVETVRIVEALPALALQPSAGPVAVIH